MKEKDAAIIKVLSDIGYADEPELTPEQEKQFERATDPEKQYLYDVEQLFSPQIQEDTNIIPNFGKSTGMRFYDNMLRNPEYFKREKGITSQIVHISPDEYLSLSTSHGKPSSGAGVYDAVVDDYVDKIKNGEELELTILDFANNEFYQEGRHRALACKKLGVPKIPVLKVEDNELTESTWAEEDGVRDRENPLPVVDASKLASVSSNAEYIYQKTADEYGEVSIENLQKIGNVENIPVSKIIGSEDYLDGEHINALVSGDIPSDDVIMAIKMRDNYYLMDGNHKAAAALIRGDKNIKALVFDISSM